MQDWRIGRFGRKRGRILNLRTGRFGARNVRKSSPNRPEIDQKWSRNAPRRPSDPSPEPRRAQERPKAPKKLQKSRVLRRKAAPRGSQKAPKIDRKIDKISTCCSTPLWELSASLLERICTDFKSIWGSIFDVFRTFVRKWRSRE